MKQFEGIHDPKVIIRAVLSESTYYTEKERVHGMIYETIDTPAALGAKVQRATTMGLPKPTAK